MVSLQYPTFNTYFRRIAIESFWIDFISFFSAKCAILGRLDLSTTAKIKWRDGSIATTPKYNKNSKCCYIYVKVYVGSLVGSKYDFAEPAFDIVFTFFERKIYSFLSYRQSHLQVNFVIFSSHTGVAIIHFDPKFQSCHLGNCICSRTKRDSAIYFFYWWEKG